VVYISVLHPTSVVIAYHGDASVAKSFPHGNAKATNRRNYVRTQPHVLREIEQTSGPARTVYQTLVTAGPSSIQEQRTAAPRDITQIRNVQSRQRNKSRLTRDALFNLHEIAQDSDFVHKIVTYPDLIVVLYSPEIMSQFNTLMSADHAQQTLSYDTTFCLGDFYLSPLLFRHTDFDPAPVIPLAYLLHERKTQATHEEFFREISSICPTLRGEASNVLIVTDQER